jgi:hypothetical protein
MQAELDELLSMYRVMTEDQKQQLIESAKAMLEEAFPQTED